MLCQEEYQIFQIILILLGVRISVVIVGIIGLSAIGIIAGLCKFILASFVWLFPALIDDSF